MTERFTRRAGLRALAFGLAMLALPAAHAEEGFTTFPDASRIASIGGSITEIVYALGEEARLIARDSTSVYPPAALSLPDVGYMRALSPEGVLSVNPSGILALEGSGPAEAVEVLRKARVPFITVPETFDRAGILEKIRVVGEAIGTPDKAAALSAKVGKELAAAEEATRSIAARKRVLFVLSMEGGKILGAGEGTAASGIIALAGAENALSGFHGYKQLTDEAIITAGPEVVLMMDRGGGHGMSEDEVFGHAALAATPAGRERRLVRMDGAYLLGFGPRTAAAALDLARALYGDQVGG